MNAGEGGPPVVDGEPADLAFSILPLATPIRVVQGGPVKVTVGVRRGKQLTGPITISVGGLGSGLTAAPLVILKESCELTISASASAPQGPAAFSIDGASKVDGADVRATTPSELFVRGTPGSLDTTFGVGGMVTSLLAPIGQLNHAGLSPDGKIVVVGTTGGGSIRAIRLTPDGTIDPSFGAQGIAATNLAVINGALPRVAIDGTGRVLVSGTDLTVNPRKPAVARFRPDGQPDPTWGANGIAAFDFVDSEGFDLAGGPLGTTFLVVASSYTRLSLLRLTSTGAVDTNFSAPVGYRTLRSPTDTPFYYHLGGRITVRADGSTLVGYSTGDLATGTSYGPMVSALPPDVATATNTAPALEEPWPNKPQGIRFL